MGTALPDLTDHLGVADDELAGVMGMGGIFSVIGALFGGVVFDHLPDHSDIIIAGLYLLNSLIHIAFPFVESLTGFGILFFTFTIIRGCLGIGNLLGTIHNLLMAEIYRGIKFSPKVIWVHFCFDKSIYGDIIFFNQIFNFHRGLEFYLSSVGGWGIKRSIIFY